MIKLGVDNGNYNTKSSEGMLYASGYAARTRPKSRIPSCSRCRPLQRQ